MKFPEKWSVFLQHPILLLQRSLHFHFFRFQPLQILNTPLDISKVSVKTSIQQNFVRPDANNHSPKQLIKRNKSFIKHDHTYQNIPKLIVNTDAGNVPTLEPNTSSPHNIAKTSLASQEASIGVPEEPVAEKSDGDSGYVSARPHCSKAQDTPSLKIKSEYDSDPDVEYVNHYTLGAPKPPTPPPSEFHDLTAGSGSDDDDWEVFMKVYKPGDLDIKPIIKLENIEPK